MRQQPDFFGNADLELVHIAKKLKDALRLEELLTASGVDYAVETDTYSGGVVFRSQRVGAFFYVAPGEVERTQHLMEQNGFQVYEGDDG
ncbi:MAG: hypothetical protein ACRD9L_28600 [Bryobacteraceae bacterium]